ncbi:hypothetical protein [Streptomyces sp. SudanB182_2057]|uniref:hypothetical protein n=1 Tax=Streptomyces sp. SudanB182_2057 TaxID=3035281 RepID=UPI003F55C3DA
MPVLRQIATCTAPSTMVVVRRSRRKEWDVDYRVAVCARHRWLAERDWGKSFTGEGVGGTCGTVIDYRGYDQVVQSHSDLWLRSLAMHGPEDRGGDVALALAAAAAFLAESRAYREAGGVTAALGHAARVAEALVAGVLGAEEGQAQVLAALSAAETVVVADRGT